MRRLAAGVGLASCLAGAIASARTQPDYRASVDLVRVTATVTTDGGRRQVAGLRAADFVIVDEGREQPIVGFSAERQPISAVFLLGISSSMSGAAFAHAREAVHAFVRDHFGAADEALVCVFNTRMTCANRWSGDAQAIAAAMAPVPTTGATRLLDAVASALELFADARHPKQVLVILSDGHDLDSRRSPREVAALLRRSEALAYAIAFPSSKIDRLIVPRNRMPGEALLNLSLLRGLTDASGGATLRVESAARIGDAVSIIVNELRSQYLLGYVMPAGRPGYREISVKLRDKPHAVRARRGYTAKE